MQWNGCHQQLQLFVRWQGSKNEVVCGVDFLLALMKILGCGILIKREVSIVIIIVIHNMDVVYSCCYCCGLFLEEEFKLNVVLAKKLTFCSTVQLSKVFPVLLQTAHGLDVSRPVLFVLIALT